VFLQKKKLTLSVGMWSISAALWSRAATFATCNWNKNFKNITHTSQLSIKLKWKRRGKEKGGNNKEIGEEGERKK
jgi:hypothetical protein